MNPEQRVNLPKVAFTSFASRFREPELKEGFEDITRVDFKVSHGPYDEIVVCGTESDHCNSSRAMRNSDLYGVDSGYDRRRHAHVL